MSTKLSVDDCAPNSLEYRQYVYFMVTSDEPLNFVGEVLGQNPIRFWNKGDRFERNGRQFQRQFSYWAMESDMRESEPLDTHFAALLDRLEASTDGLRKVQEKCNCRIVCVSYSIQSFGFILTAQMQARCVALGLDIEFDMYNLLDPHDEIMDLRSLVDSSQSHPTQHD